jgi:hypothetical protein
MEQEIRLQMCYLSPEKRAKYKDFVRFAPLYIVALGVPATDIVTKAILFRHKLTF